MESSGPSRSLVARILSAAEKLSTGWLFYVPALITCFVMAFLSPPMQAPDEPAHMFRAYHISLGHLLSVREGDTVGGKLPRDLAVFWKMGGPFPVCIMKADLVRKKPVIDMKVIRVLMQQPPANRSKRIFFAYNSSAFYPPAGYIPQALGLAISSKLGCSPLATVYAGRLFNALCYVLLAGAAIRTMPAQRWLMAVIALLPMALFQAASLSPDGFTNGLSLLFIAQVLALAAGRQDASRARKSAFIVIALSFLLALSKSCLPMLLLPLAVSPSRFANRRRYWLWAASVFAVYAVTLAVWGYLNRNLIVPADPAKNPLAQWHAICSDPRNFLHSLAGAFLYKSDYYLHSFVGLLGWTSVRLPLWVIIGSLSWLMILSAAEFSATSPAWTGRTRAVSLTCFFLCAFWIFIWLYLSWCVVGQSRPLEGVQGRYFIAFAPLLGIALLSERRPAWERGMKICLAVWIYAVEAAAIYSLWRVYY